MAALKDITLLWCNGQVGSWNASGPLTYASRHRASELHLGSCTKYLSGARRAELVGSTLTDERAKDQILDETVWRRLPASLPSYSQHLLVENADIPQRSRIFSA
jgi:hypothetical protein